MFEPLEFLTKTSWNNLSEKSQDRNLGVCVGTTQQTATYAEHKKQISQASNREKLIHQYECSPPFITSPDWARSKCWMLRFCQKLLDSFRVLHGTFSLFFACWRVSLYDGKLMRVWMHDERRHTIAKHNRQATPKDRDRFGDRSPFCRWQRRCRRRGSVFTEI